MATTSMGEIKRGETIEFQVTIRDKTTQELVTGLTDNLLCQARYGVNQDILFEMNIEETSTGIYKFTTDYDTQLLIPNYKVLFDIQYIDIEGKIKSSDTFYIAIEGNISYGD